FFFIWLRGALPRVRYDQLMKLGWKILMPVSLAWILLVATIRVFANEGYDMRQFLLYGGIAVAVLLALSLVWDSFVGERGQEIIEGAVPAEEGAPDAAAGGFPVPPLDAPHYHGERGAVDKPEVSSGLH
ncbi:MAG: NADH-quinone oxidoreductase subunit H, partial [Actinomadura sp.]